MSQGRVLPQEQWSLFDFRKCAANDILCHNAHAPAASRNRLGADGGPPPAAVRALRLRLRGHLSCTDGSGRRGSGGSRCGRGSTSSGGNGGGATKRRRRLAYGGGNVPPDRGVDCTGSSRSNRSNGNNSSNLRSSTTALLRCDFIGIYRDPIPAALRPCRRGSCSHRGSACRADGGAADAQCSMAFAPPHCRTDGGNTAALRTPHGRSLCILGDSAGRQGG
mmetsp:Transcript_9924/g.34833  ORF Transcript_9924/g.34833 Transcript_9924/m.34833 type:complete len:221 (+) Transcript_9924:508-1170(+)